MPAGVGRPRWTGCPVADGHEAEENTSVGSLSLAGDMSPAWIVRRPPEMQADTTMPSTQSRLQLFRYREDRLPVLLFLLLTTLDLTVNLWVDQVWLGGRGPALGGGGAAAPEGLPNHRAASENAVAQSSLDDDVQPVQEG